MSTDPTTRFPPTEVRAIADLSVVRRDFATWLRNEGLPADRIEDLSVVLSELVANAVRETPMGSPPTTVTAEVSRSGEVHLEVANTVDVDTTSLDRDWDLTDPLRTGGRGLLLVSAFVDDVEVDVIDDRLVLRCTASA